MSNDLQCCPFCGDDDLLPMYDDTRHVWEIGCGECSATVQAATEQETIAVWNRRYPTAKEAALELALEEANSRLAWCDRYEQ